MLSDNKEEAPATRQWREMRKIGETQNMSGKCDVFDVDINNVSYTSMMRSASIGTRKYDMKNRSTIEVVQERVIVV